jgi:hypothetical protein
LRQFYPAVTEWTCWVVPWENLANMSEIDRRRLYTKLAEMDNWENSEGSIHGSEFECFLVFSREVFNDPLFRRPESGQLNWSEVRKMLVCTC